MTRFAGFAVVVTVLIFFGFGCGDVSNNPNAPTSVVEACKYTFLPSKIVTSSAPKNIVVRITTGPTCRWIATADDLWINIVFQGSNGTGDLILNVERNQCTSRARTGFIRIKGSKNVLEIFQDGSDLGFCPKTIL